MTDRVRWIILGTLTAATALVVSFTGPVAQWADYHDFADNRSMFGIPNFWDVVSNIPFFIVALLGLRELKRQRAAGQFTKRLEELSYFLFFISVALSGFASTYYHLLPGDARLIWDRVPIVGVVMALVCIILQEKVSLRVGLRSLVPLTLLGVLSIFHWKWTGDLRVFGFVQFYPILFIGLVLWLFPRPFPAGRQLGWLVLYYGLAKFFELKDGAVYAATGLVSGHTLKHLFAAFAVYWVVRMLRMRKKLEGPNGLA